MKNNIKKILVSVILIVSLQSNVNSKPLSNNLDKTSAWIVDSIRNAVDVDSKSKSVQSTSEHAFIKLDAIKDHPSDGSIVIKGDSSMRLFNHTDINHPSFDPSHFLNLAKNESVQSVEVQPVSDQPYFMFIQPELLKDHTFERLLFDNVHKRRRRFKRHHPGNSVQNILGELQNYALVPIKSNNGQIRYILLKNPKFVISNPSTTGGMNGQLAPTIIQLNSNNQASGIPGGKIRYTPRTPAQPATQPPFRRVPSGRRQAPVAVATPIDSIFNTQSSETTRSKTFIEKIKSTKTTRTSGKRRKMPKIPSTWEQLRRKYIANKQNNLKSNTVGVKQGSQSILNSNSKSGNLVVASKSSINGGSRTVPLNGINANLMKESSMPITVNELDPKASGGTQSGGNAVPNTDLLMLTDVASMNNGNALNSAPISGGTQSGGNAVPNTDLLMLTDVASMNNGNALNSAPISGIAKTVDVGPTIKAIASVNANPVDKTSTQIISETKSSQGNGLNQMPIGQSKTTSIQQKSNSVLGDKITSSASSVKETAGGLKASVADTTLAKLEANETNVNQTNTKNITITKVGDHHKIEQTEIVETVVDVKKNATATKTATASSKVVSNPKAHDHSHGGHAHNHGSHAHDHGSHAHDHGSHAGHTDHGAHGAAESQGAANTVSANAGAAEKATAEKNAQVVKKTKKTTTILLKSGSETKSGKAEISEIQHTVEEMVHHNTSEKAGAETAASANVDAKTAVDPHAAHDHSHHDHGHAHAHDAPPVKTEKTAIAEAKKETNSTSTSVKTKSVKQTVIKKNVPDPNTPASSNSASPAKAVNGTDVGGGFDVQHVEHVVRETEHTVQQDKSQISNHKAKSSSEPSQNHHHHH